MTGLLNFDKTITTLIYNIKLPEASITILNLITHMADIIFVALALIIVFVFLLHKLMVVEAIIFTLGIFFSGILIQFLKLVVGRLRPLVFRVSPEAGFSFPSGHALSAIVFYGFLIWILNRLIKRKWIKYVLTSVSVLLIVIVGFSRIYLGFHWALDVLAGWMIGGIILFIMIKLSKLPTAKG